MHPAIEAALELQQFLDEHGEKFCIIGGLAVQRWGEVRLTVDADATSKLPNNKSTSVQSEHPIVAMEEASGKVQKASTHDAGSVGVDLAGLERDAGA